MMPIELWVSYRAQAHYAGQRRKLTTYNNNKDARKAIQKIFKDNMVVFDEGTPEEMYIHINHINHLYIRET